jgi:hypothetical protein
MGRCSVLFQAVAAGWVEEREGPMRKGERTAVLGISWAKELWVARGCNIGEQ